jgi:hypothetical protein
MTWAHFGNDGKDGGRTFEGGALAALALTEEEDPDVGTVLLELCTLCAELLIDRVTDPLGIFLCEEAGIALGESLVGRGTEDSLERVVEDVLWDGPGSDHGGWSRGEGNAV